MTIFINIRINGNQNQSVLLKILPKLVRTDSTLIVTLDEQEWSNVPQGATHLQLQIHVFEFGTFVFDQNTNGYKIQNNSNEYQHADYPIKTQIISCAIQLAFLKKQMLNTSLSVITHFSLLSSPRR